MIASWMSYSLAIGVLLGVAALAADRGARALRLPTRGAWLGALVATSLLSLLALVRLLRPDAPAVVPLPAAANEAAPAATGAAGAWETILERLGGLPQRLYAAAAEVVPADAVLLGLWALCSGLLLVVAVATLHRLARARRGWEPGRIGDVDVLVSRDFGPAVVGLLHPAIVVPAWLLERSPEWQRLTVQHEDEHRRARDPLLLLVAGLTVVLLPWHVALWWVLRRTRLAMELDCDARVLRGGVAPLSYGTLLLDIAGQARARYLAAPALADSRLHLERRLLAMTAPRTRSGQARAAAAGSAALLLAVLACGTDLPTSADIEALDAATAQQYALRADTIHAADAGLKPFFYVDGKLVSEAEALAIRPEDIATVEVHRAGGAYRAEADANGAIRILTKQAAELLPAKQPSRAAAARGDVVIAHGKVPAESGTAVFAKVRRAPSEAEPLLFIDGIVASHATLRSLPPEQIERIEVLKADAAAAAYGDRGRNGVVRITTKAKR